MWIDSLVVASAHKSLSAEVWIPKDTLVVLGSSNQESKELNITNVREDRISVLRRLGGGGAVVLHSGCIIVSLGAWVSHPYQNSFYFELINQALIETLTLIDQGFKGLSTGGISDIVFGDRKIAGTSMFRSKNFLMYQASLLWDPKIHLIEKYLCHPSKEPDYRASRGHKDFVMGLCELSSMAQESITRQLSSKFLDELSKKMADHLVSPNHDVILHLNNRLKLSE